jgi:outer membrane protein TolC
MGKTGRPAGLGTFVLLTTILTGTGRAQPPSGEMVVLPPLRPVLAAPACPGGCLDPRAVLQGPVVSSSPAAGGLPIGQPASEDHPLPINLPTALRMADARPLVIAAAQASVRQAAARLEQAQALWLPNLNLGASYYRHDGAAMGNSGNLFIGGRDQFLAGYGLTGILPLADALFVPREMRQVLRSRQIDVQTARNDALLAVAEAYFNVQQARGRLAGARDALAKGRGLERTVRALGKGLTPPIEADRVRTLLADLERAATSAYEDWRVASADLTRALRLNPSAVVAPLEPPHLQVTLISPNEPVDTLIPLALQGRPELASQQALVQATLERLRQERIRPLVPSVVLLGDTGRAAPGGFLTGGVYGTDANGRANPWAGRNDVDVQLVWELRNLGFGNRALVRERQAEQQRALIELYRVQDQVAGEVAQAHARVQSAAARTTQAEIGLKEAQTTFAGNMKGLSETTRTGDLLILVNRPQEAVAALQQLARAYDNYFVSANDYNRAQFQLYRALGYPAGILACERPAGPLVPVDATRPAQMAPVCN